MKSFKILLTVLISLLAVAFSVPALTGISLVFQVQSVELEPIPAVGGTTVCVLKDFDFESGEWAAYIVTANSDLSGLPEGVPKQTFLSLTDKAILKEMQREWCFDGSGGDMGTVESSVAVLQNGKLRWRSGIVIDSGTEGLQSPQFGWVTPQEKYLLAKYARKFEPSIFPFHII